MRKQLTILALLAAASLPAKDIFVNTPRTTLLLKAEDNKPLHISYYGDKVTDAEEVYRAFSLWQEAYPAFGLGNDFIPALSAALGVFIPLIVVNCIIIGRAEAFCQKNPIGPSFFDGIFQGFGYTCVLIVMCVVRELLGSGRFGGGLIDLAKGITMDGTGAGIQIFPSTYGAAILNLPFGGFLTLGCLIALMQYALKKSAKKKELAEKAAKEADE